MLFILVWSSYDRGSCAQSVVLYTELGSWHYIVRLYLALPCVKYSVGIETSSLESHLYIYVYTNTVWNILLSNICKDSQRRLKSYKLYFPDIYEFLYLAKRFLSALHGAFCSPPSDASM